ncbi:MAG: hypothetical protein QW598_00255 [Pyrobaculum sp.]
MNTENLVYLGWGSRETRFMPNHDYHGFKYLNVAELVAGNYVDPLSRLYLHEDYCCTIIEGAILGYMARVDRHKRCGVKIP